MAIYRNERIPDFSFLLKLKQVDENLFPVFDSVSMCWDILYKNPEYPSLEPQQVYRVCKRDSEGVNVGYEPLDDRVIWKLRRMDLKTAGISPEEYRKRVNAAETAEETRQEIKLEEEMDYIFKHEKRTIGRAFDALRGVYRRF